jgi:molecular chaperone GrpE
MAEHNRRAHAGDPAARDAETQADGATAEEIVASLREQIEQERQRADTNYANWQRATADFINYKRRTEQDREESGRYANTALILNVLPAVDDLERALQHVDPELENSPWIDGVRQIMRKLKGALAAAGVSEIPAEGEAFDPNLHEAIAEADGEEGKVISEAQRGYRLGNRVIRPSMVVVGRAGRQSSDDRRDAPGNGSEGGK